MTSAPTPRTKQIAPKHRRRREEFTTLTKLRAVARYLRCPGLPAVGVTCGKQFGKLEEIQFDHSVRDALGGGNGEDNCVPLCRDCHHRKTFGVPATTAGSDIHMEAKAKRLQKKSPPITVDQKAMQARLLAKDTGETDSLPKSKWGSRGFPCGRGSTYKKRMNGTVVRRDAKEDKDQD